MVQYTNIQTLTGGIIKTQWYANGIPVTADEVPQSVKDKCCDCGCGDSGGGGVTNISFKDGGGVKHYDDPNVPNQHFFSIGDTFAAKMPLVTADMAVANPEEGRWIWLGNYTNAQFKQFLGLVNAFGGTAFEIRGYEIEEDTDKVVYSTLDFNTNQVVKEVIQAWNQTYFSISRDDESISFYDYLNNKSNNANIKGILLKSLNNAIQIQQNNEINFNQFTVLRDDADPTSIAWFDQYGDLKRTNLANAIGLKQHVPKPLISRNYNKELINKSFDSINSFKNRVINVPAFTNPTVPVITFNGNDPNTATVFTPNYPQERGVIYKEIGQNNYWKYENGNYTPHDDKFTYDDIANQGVIWLSVAVESGQDMSFFTKNKPMLIAEVYVSKTKRQPRHRTSNNDFRFKKWQTWNFKSGQFENLNRPLNTKETGSKGLNQAGDGNGVKYFASQWDFTPTKNNSEMIFRLDVHALFGEQKTSNVPGVTFPVPLISTYGQAYTPRYLNKRGNAGVKTSFRQPIRFRFACVDPKDDRNLIYSEPTKTYMLGIKSGQFREDKYAYQFQMKEVSK